MYTVRYNVVVYVFTNEIHLLPKELTNSIRANSQNNSANFWDTGRYSAAFSGKSSRIKPHQIITSFQQMFVAFHSSWSIFTASRRHRNRSQFDTLWVYLCSQVEVAEASMENGDLQTGATVGITADILSSFPRHSPPFVVVVEM